MPDNNQSSWAAIIAAVTSIMGLSALAILALGAGFTVVLYKTPEEKQFQTYVLLAVTIGFLVIANMVNLYVTQKLELTFRIRVATGQSELEIPCEGIVVGVFKNGTKMLDAYTDEMGICLFTVKLQRNDEIYAVVTSEGGPSNKAAIYSSGQCQMLKTIRI